MENQYKKLSAKRRRNFREDTLWIGSDHLLHVKYTSMIEQYQRFYFKDIKGIITFKTRVSMINQLIVSLFILLFSFALYLIWNKPNHDVIPLIIIISVFSIFLVYLLISGPTCQCWIITATQTKKLSAVTHLRPAKKMLSAILPLIEKTQGHLDNKEIETFDSNLIKISWNTRHEKGDWHKFLFIGLVVYGISSIMILYFRPYFFIKVMSFAFFILWMASLGAIIRQKKSQLDGYLKFMTWAGFIVLVSKLIQNYISFIFFLSKATEKPPVTETSIIGKIFCQINPFDYPVILWTDIVMICLFVLIGFGGIILLKRQS